MKSLLKKFVHKVKLCLGFKYIEPLDSGEPFYFNQKWYYFISRWNNLWHPFSIILFPRQRWLTKQIPRFWMDKDRLWEICILEGLKHHIEQDDGGGWFGYVNEKYEWTPIDSDSRGMGEYWAKIHCETKRNYDLVTKILPVLEKELEQAWKEVPVHDFKNLKKPNWPPYDVIYGKVNALEEKIEKLKTDVMIWCINNRGGIWT